MNYAIHTLEIEIARLRVAERKVEETVFIQDSEHQGYRPDFEDFDTKISQLKGAIKVLREAQKVHI